MNNHANDGIAQLFNAGLAGDRAAYAQALEQLSPRLRRVIGHKIPLCDVEDVLQEVLISIHKARHTYDSARPFVPWVMAITGFRMADHLRDYYRQMRHQMEDLSEYEHALPAVTDTPSSTEFPISMLHGVGDRERTILMLMHVEGYSVRQIGATLGMKESAVKVAAHRAIKKLRMQGRHG